jgi:hypothetical protein
VDAAPPDPAIPSKQQFPTMEVLMRKVIVSEFVSLDGVMEALDQ